MLEIIKKLIPSRGSKSVLIVDDSELDRTVVSRMLAKKYTVFTADGGREGIRMAREKRPDVIILDFMMPDLNGPEVCRQLHLDETTKNIPVIFLTSAATPLHMLESYAQHADAFLGKPAHPKELIWHIERVLAPADFEY
jgi:two-component system alkaline phosphatase synthesis response regulator PhoP